MQKALSIWQEIKFYLPEIKNTLGDQWPHFTKQIQAKAKLFEGLTNKQALDEAADQLFGLFMANNTVEEIMTRSGTDRHPLDRSEPAEIINLETVANRFYLLCQNPDRAIEQIQTGTKARGVSANQEKHDQGEHK